ncbi:MAG: monosaccharide transporter rane protein family [Clostridiales bacterium]|nr:monosaccharide transporter rane protein family [Clostridiales bacterium]
MKNINEKLKRISESRLFWPLVGLVLVLCFNLVFVKDFFGIEMKEGHLYGRIIDIVKNAGCYMLLAIGMTLVVATGGIDISVGSMCAISGAVMAAFVGGDLSGVPQHSYAIAIAAALVISLVLGLWNGFLVAKLNIQPVVATLILMVAGRGIAQLVTKGQIITVYYKPYGYLGSFTPGLILPTSIFIVAIVLIATLITVKKTALGLFIQSAGINRTASRFSGIKVQKLIYLVYGFSGLCAGIAGLVISSMVKAADGNNAGLGYEMDAILAVALGGNSMNGGKFSIMGSIIGALIIQSLTTTMYAIGISPQVLPVVKAIVVITICLIQSEGLHRMVLILFRKDRRLQHEQAAIKF